MDYPRKPIVSIFIMLLLCVIVSSCGDGLQEVRIFAEDGTLEKKYFIDKDSLKQGELITFFGNGVGVFERAQYLDDRLHGVRTLYFESGQVEIVEHYLQDILVDTLKLYYEDGQLRMTSIYDMGVHTGLNTQYYPNGQVMEEVWFENNEEQGLFVEYYENGQIKWKGQYINGDNEVGELLHYNDRGILIKKMYCDSQSICRTTWTIEKGDIVSQNRHAQD